MKRLAGAALRPSVHAWIGVLLVAAGAMAAVPGGSQLSAARSLPRATGLDLVVTDGDNLIAGVKVSASNADGAESVGVSDEQGHVRLEFPGGDELVIEAETPWGEPATARAKVPAGEGPLRGVLRLRPPDAAGGSPAAFLQADRGEPGEGAWIVRRSVVSTGDLAAPGAETPEASFAEQLLADPSEPDSCASPLTASDGLVDTREIGITSDQDFYKIDLACGDTLRVEVTPTTKELAPLIDFYSDSTCTTILTTAGTFLNGTPTLLLRSINTAGTYRVRIRSNAGASWGGYTVAFKVTPGTCPPPTEGADSDSCTAPPTIANNNVFEREINPNSDNDYYTFSWSCGQIIRITVTPSGTSPTLNPTFDLFSPLQPGCTGTPTTVNGSVGQPASTASLLVDPNFNGIWTLRIRSNAGGTGGTYRVAFVIASTGLCSADPFEPDNTAAQARPLPANGSTELHNIQQNNLVLDEDWYKVTLGCGDRITVRTASGAPRDGVTTVQLRDSTGITIVATDSTGGGSSFSLLDRLVASAGLYYIRVSSTTALGSYVIHPFVRTGTRELQVPVTQTPLPGGVQLDAAAKTPSVSYASITGAKPPIDISLTGTRLSVGDDTGRGFPIGFLFKLFEDVHNTVTVASNGYLTFGTTSTALGNACPVPTTTVPNDLIAPMWDDWAPQNGGSVYIQTLGSAPTRQFVAMWELVPHFGTGGTHTFEAILNEGSNLVEYRYGTLSGAAESNGSSATVGVEDVLGARGLQVSCNQSGIIGTNISFDLNATGTLVNYPAVVTYSNTQPNTPMTDISGTGVNLNLTDESFQNNLALGFTFSYYGVDYTQVSVSANGFASFSTLASATFTNACPLLNTAVPNATVAPFWDDLNPSGSNNVYMQTLGSAPNRQFVLQWKNVPFFSGGGATNFEILFNETANTVDFRYGAFSGPVAANGSSATVGLENQIGTASKQISCNTAGFTSDGTSYLFTGSAPAPSFVWKNDVNGATLATGPSYFAPTTGTCKVRLDSSVNDVVTGCPLSTTQLFTFPDTVKPTLTCSASGAACPAPIGSSILGTNGEVTICLDFCAEVGAVGTDNCVLGGVVLTGSSAGAPVCTGNPCKMLFPTLGDFVYTWQATDAAGNSDTCTSTVHVIRSTVCNNTPTANAGGPYSGTCSASLSAATATDPDGDAMTYVWTSSSTDVTITPASGSIPAGPGAKPVPVSTATLKNSVAPCGVNVTLTLTVTDTFGAVATSIATVTFDDKVKPTLIGVPAAVTVECSAVPVKANVTATDNCDPAPTVTFVETKTPGTCTDGFTLTRTWTGKDRCNNIQTGTQVITVKDSTPPTLVGVPASVTVECDKVPLKANVTATDNCDPAPVVTFSEVKTNGSCPDNYTLTRTWTGKDRCGNTKLGIQVITVKDADATDLIGVPADVTVECDKVPVPPPVTAADNCDPAPTVVYSELRIDGSCPDKYTLKRTWTATDRCSNVASKTQTINVVDTTKPTPMPALEPAVPLPPRSTTEPHSVCVQQTKRTFLVRCAASDNCDPQPAMSPSMVVTQYDVPVKDGACQQRIDQIPVACDELLEIELSEPNCPAHPAKPRSALSVDSQGVKHLRGEKVVLALTATDRCGNAATASFDPTVQPSPLCDDKLDDGTCCPALSAPPDPKCKLPLCGR